MAESALTNACQNPDCEVRTTGVCVNAHQPLEACPDYISATDTGVELETDPAEPPIVDDDAEPNSVETNHVALHPGLALDVEGVDQFLRMKSATFVAIVGERDSGKTTLSCAIYDRFLKGPFAELVFAASHTLVTFERRAHPSRVESGRVKPDTPRTSLSEGLKFLHLDVASINNLSNRSSLMLSDRAGEKYKQARGQTKMIEELIEISHADRVVLLLDGARLVDPTLRAGAMQNVRQMIRALVDNGALTQKSIVQVVTTKVD